MSNLSTSNKPHYPILDGLRGVAALLVIAFHLLEALFLDPKNHPMHHGFLAVDFFFLLSGYVIGYAYDDRWDNMNLWQFFKIRLIRLHPLVIFSIILGVIGFLLDPYAYTRPVASGLKITATILLGLFLIPAPDVRGWGETHSINGPHWSLLQEYIANILYGTLVRKFNKLALWILVFLCALVLILVANNLDHLGTGWSLKTFPIALSRMMFPFFAGLLLFRSGKIIKLPMAFLISALLLATVFFMPVFSYNGLFEACMIIFVFPLIVAIGAGGEVKGFWLKVCKFAGDISYPIYILHYPFTYIYFMWVVIKKPSHTVVMPVAIGLGLFFILIAYASLKLFDEPVRKWLKSRFLK